MTVIRDFATAAILGELLAARGARGTCYRRRVARSVAFAWVIAAGMGSAGCQLVFGYDGGTPDTGGQADAPSDAGPDGDTTCSTLRYFSPGNFDGDAFTDERSDPCPFDGTSAGNNDSDGDGVGDGCDPRPGAPGDCVLAFVSFTESTLPCWTATKWAPCNGGWCADRDAADAALAWSIPLDPQPAQIELRGTIDAIGAAPREVLIGRGDAPQLSACGIADAGGVAAAEALTFATNRAINKLSGDPPFGASTTQVTVRSLEVAAARTCFAFLGLQQAMVNHPEAIVPGAFVIRSTNTQFRAASLIVFGRDTACD